MYNSKNNSINKVNNNSNYSAAKYAKVTDAVDNCLLVDKAYIKWHYIKAHALGVQAYLETAAKAQEGNNPRKYFVWLLNHAV